MEQSLEVEAKMAERYRAAKAKKIEEWKPDEGSIDEDSLIPLPDQEIIAKSIPIHIDPIEVTFFAGNISRCFFSQAHLGTEIHNLTTKTQRSIILSGTLTDGFTLKVNHFADGNKAYDTPNREEEYEFDINNWKVRRRTNQEDHHVPCKYNPGDWSEPKSLNYTEKDDLTELSKIRSALLDLFRAKATESPDYIKLLEHTPKTLTQLFPTVFPQNNQPAAS